MSKLNISLVDEKLNEIKSSISRMKTRDDISKSTRNTQLYHLKREQKILHLIHSLIKLNPDIKLPDEDIETCVSLTTLQSERATTKYQFAVGDNLLDIMDKYENLSRKDLDSKLDKLGLKMNYTTHLVEKK